MNAHEALELANVSLLKNIEDLIESSALDGKKSVTFSVHKDDVLKIISHLEKLCYVVNTSVNNKDSSYVEVIWREDSIAQKLQPYR